MQSILDYVLGDSDIDPDLGEDDSDASDVDSNWEYEEEPAQPNNSILATATAPKNAHSVSNNTAAAKAGAGNAEDYFFSVETFGISLKKKKMIFGYCNIF